MKIWFPVRQSSKKFELSIRTTPLTVNAKFENALTRQSEAQMCEWGKTYFNIVWCLTPSSLHCLVLSTFYTSALTLIQE